MVLDIPKGVKNVDKVKEEEEEANLKKKVIVALTVNRLKQIGCLI
jgi:hypothetical protein